MYTRKVFFYKFLCRTFHKSKKIRKENKNGFSLPFCNKRKTQSTKEIYKLYEIIFFPIKFGHILIKLLFISHNLFSNKIDIVFSIYFIAAEPYCITVECNRRIGFD
jgi:hypothetical protein